jgi:hypothetical protein
MVGNQLGDFAFRPFQVAEHQGVPPVLSTLLDTGWDRRRIRLDPSGILLVQFPVPFPDSDAMRAQRAGLRHPMRSLWLGYRSIVLSLDGQFVVFEVKPPGIVRAGNHAVPTSYAPVVIHNHHTIFAPIGSLDGTDLGAGRVVAMIAHQDHEFPDGLGFSSGVGGVGLLLDLYPSDPIDVVWDVLQLFSVIGVVLFLARDNAWYFV